MCAHVNTLPDDCLLLIFDRIPLLDLLQLDQICPRWAKLLTPACARRRTLVLILGGRRLDDRNFKIPFNSTIEVSFDGRQPYFHLPFSEREVSIKLPYLVPHNVSCRTMSFDEFLLDDVDSEGFLSILYRNSMDTEIEFTEMARLRNAHLSGRLVAYLTDLFPNVHTLVVINTECYEKELYSLVALLRQSWSLRTVKLWLRILDIDEQYIDRSDQHPLHALLHSINQLSSLQQLTLDICGSVFNGFTFSVKSFFFIAQLKVLKLYFGWYDRGYFILDIVHRYDSKQLRHIGLGNNCWPRENFLNVALKPKLEVCTAKVCQLYSDLSFESVEQFGAFCKRYSSLSTLQMYWSPNITFTQLVFNLASLTQLTHLKLDFYFDNHPENPFVLVDQVNEDKPRPVSLPQVFPSVGVIMLNDNRSYLFGLQCSICSPDHAQFDDQKANQCHRLLVHSLKTKFANSVRFYANGEVFEPFVDWTNNVNAEQEDLFEIWAEDDDYQPEEDEDDEAR